MSNLTPRQQEILRVYADTQSTGLTARRLGISTQRVSEVLRRHGIRPGDHRAARRQERLSILEALQSSQQRLRQLERRHSARQTRRTLLQQLSGLQGTIVSATELAELCGGYPVLRARWTGVPRKKGRQRPQSYRNALRRVARLLRVAVRHRGALLFDFRESP